MKYSDINRTIEPFLPGDIHDSDDLNAMKVDFSECMRDILQNICSETEIEDIVEILTQINHNSIRIKNMFYIFYFVF